MKYLIIIILTIVACNSGNPSYHTNPPVFGPPGSNGHNSLIKIVTSTTCTNGGSLLLTGLDLNDDTVLSNSEVQYSADICNGASPMYTPVIIIEPCGHNSSPWKEALLGLAGGGIFAEFTGNASDASTVRNTLIPDGSYYTTDASQCNFTVTTDGSGNRSVTWNGSTHNGSGPFSAGFNNFTLSTMQWN